MKAVELSTEEAESFFRDVLGPYVRRIPLSRWLIAAVAGPSDIIDDPRAAAERHPVFEQHPAAQPFERRPALVATTGEVAAGPRRGNIETRRRRRRPSYLADRIN